VTSTRGLKTTRSASEPAVDLNVPTTIQTRIKPKSQALGHQQPVPAVYWFCRTVDGQVRQATKPEPQNLDLHELASSIRSGRLTATSVIESCLQKYREWEPRIHAFAWLDPERAMLAAKRVDEKVAKGLTAGSLAGVPIGIKDILDTAGMPTEFGSEIFKGRVPHRSAATVLALEREDAVLFGKTVTAELAYYTPGPTRNPWDVKRTPGGSSMGSAAAVSAGVIPASVGTQTNGSIVRPAAFCGVVGFKPTFGWLSVDGVMPFSATLDHVGTFARSVQDVALLVAAMSGQPTDVTIFPRSRAPRLAVARTPGWGVAEPAMHSRFASDLTALAGAGAIIDSPPLPKEFEAAVVTHTTIMAVEAYAALGPQVLPQRHLLSEQLAKLLDQGAATPGAFYKAALRRRKHLIELFQTWVQPYDAALTIPTAGEAPPADTTGDPRFCTPWTLLGVPTITVPTGTGPAGLPLGLQIVSAPGRDRDLLGVALWVEAALHATSTR
jgi:Asp-tRNA(Asn)/Glu-tRNA(Gln) amidotransferase A subunit family amidase